MTRFAWLAVAAFGGLVATAGPAPAQFTAGYNLGAGPRQPFTGLGVPYPNFRFALGGMASLNTPFGRYSAGGLFYGPAGYYYLARQGYRYNPYALPSGGSYMSGGVANPALDAARDDLARAQKAAASMMSARGAVHDQWAYEKFGVPAAGVKAGADAPDAVLRALAATDERVIATGEPLNHLAVAAAAAEKKAGKVESAFLPPNLLADLVFAGPKADAVNLLRKGGRLDYPPGFDVPALAEARAALDREFAALAAPVLSGKAGDVTRAAKLEAAVADARKALAPQVHEMSFEDATAARRFLNQLDAAARTLKGPGTAGLVDPAWRVEGTNAAGLVRYLGRNNLLFAPAAPGTEDRYVAAHRALATYLFSLNEAQKR